MASLIFYRQKRNDGAIRTGVELDGETIAERFEEGGRERDPALLWFIDFRCEGQGIPDDPENATQWLLDHSKVIRDGIVRYAEQLKTGADPDFYSLTWSEFQGLPENVSIVIACSAIRRVDARQMAVNLIDLADHWNARIPSLDIPQEAEDLC